MVKLGKDIFSRILSAAVALIMILTLLPGQNAFAADIDLAKKGTMTVTHHSVDDEPLAGVKSRIYRIASVDPVGKYTVLDEFSPVFSDSGFFNNGFKFDAWKACVDGVKSYVKAKDIKPYKEGVSDKEGKTYYTDLELGIYLVISDNLIDDKYVYSFSDFVYPLPLLERDKETEIMTWTYNVEVSPKKEREERIIDDEFVVYKRWSDSGYENNRPTSITVKIYCDEKLYKSVTLSASNNWKYSWSYEPGHDWKLVETSTGENYTASLSTSKKEKKYTFVFTNTYNPPETPPGTPPDPETPPSTPDLPSVLGAIRDLPEVLGARRLPQTGQLWWPLPILVLFGVFFIIKGIRKNAKA
ncbi:Cna B-type domain-containing protein [Butyrivibrio sp. MC2021]|uniref:Cna B-type domain-containing protein n=1 Tax=Butyrivibrio sp. MC2021 TaxID=1408306 RepID=UPI00047CD3DD|nr:Cna B-type domain-containing protein [Butyrivibrio sp. MC2021]